MRRHPIAFDFEPVGMGEKIIAFKFTPLHYPQRENGMPKCVTYNGNCLSLGISETAMSRLSKNSIGFTEVEIKNNIEGVQKGIRNFAGFTLRLALLKGKKQREENNPQRMDYSRPRGVR